MFEVGRDYWITMIESDGGTTTGVSTVAEVDGTLITLQNPHSADIIVNTASLHFVSAQLVEEQRARPAGTFVLPEKGAV